MIFEPLDFLARLASLVPSWKSDTAHLRYDCDERVRIATQHVDGRSAAKRLYLLLECGQCLHLLLLMHGILDVGRSLRSVQVVGQGLRHLRTHDADLQAVCHIGDRSRKARHPPQTQLRE